MKGLSALQDLAAGRTIRQFATKYQLVYFGGVDSRTDEHQLVRGITASVNHVDNHYCVGTFNSHDIMLVERRNTLTHPGKPSRNYKWLIMAVDLRVHSLPHIFFDGLHHEETFYANMHIGFSRLQDLSSIVAPLGKMRIFASTDAIATVQGLLTPEFVQILSSANQFDYELSDDQVYVYSNGGNVGLALLTDMLRVGVHIAEHLNAHYKPDQ